MTHAAETGAPSKVLLSEIVAAYTRGVGRERSHLDLQWCYPMADIAGDLFMFFSLVSKAGTLASSLGPLRLGFSHRWTLKIRRRGFFSV